MVSDKNTILAWPVSYIYCSFYNCPHEPTAKKYQHESEDDATNYGTLPWISVCENETVS